MRTLPADLDARLLAYLRDELGVDAPGIDTLLLTDGLVDSAGLMRVVGFIEDATGVTIPDRDVTVRHFDSIRQMLAYLAAADR